MAEKMSLQDAGLYVRAAAKANSDRATTAILLEQCADAIDAHLAQPAQAVDVGAIREVIKRLEEHPLSDEWKVFDQCADKLTHAISGKPL